MRTEKDWTDWFNEKPRVTKKNPDKSEYVPIGIIEEDLDQMDSWNTAEEQFHWFTAGRDTYVCSSIVLIVSFGNKSKSVVGSSTMKVNPNNPNEEYRASLLSKSLSNAAKKLGTRFGRALNGRMESGETAEVPVIQLQTIRDLEKIEDFFNEHQKRMTPENKTIFQRVIQNREVSSYKKLLKIITDHDQQPDKKRKL